MSPLEDTFWDWDKVLNPLLWAGLASPPVKTLNLSLCLVTVQLRLLLQRGHLAAPNLNLLCILLGELELKTMAETEWFGSGVGATFPSLSA